MKKTVTTTRPGMAPSEKEQKEIITIGGKDRIFKPIDTVKR